MSDTKLKWYFPFAKNVSGRGENDPQKELFPGDVFQTMIRESIQNSLDHPDKESGKPVRVEYSLRKYLTSVYSFIGEGDDNLKTHIKSCYDISHADKFKRMLDALKADYFYMLEVADYNTIGMDYDLNEDRGRFKKFVRYTGDPNEVTGAGGSHGYGKITYFSVSEINTIIVSSMTLDGTRTFEGTSRLATHPTKEQYVSYLDTGFLDKGDGFPVQCKNGDEDSLIPELFRREKPGTTVYIPFVNIDEGTNEKSKLFKKCCEAVLRNFFAAINDGSLEVSIDFCEHGLFENAYQFEFKQDNIEDAFNNHFFNDPPYDTAKSGIFDKFNPHPYWLAYKNGEVIDMDVYSQAGAEELCAGKRFICFKKTLPIIGSSSLFINVDHQFGNDVVLFMRCPRMVVQVQRNTSGRGYSAVFLCDDDEKGKGNELLRNMEDAAHRTWSKRQLKFDKRPKEKIEQAGQIEEEMRSFIKNCLEVVFPASQNDSDDIELEDFTIPMMSDNDATNPLIGSLINKQGQDESVKGAPVDLHSEKQLPPYKNRFIGKAQTIEPKKAVETDKETDWSGGRRGKRKAKYHGNKSFEFDTDGEEKTVRVKFHVKYRVLSDEQNDGDTKYTLIIHSPQQVEKAYLKLMPVGETDDKSNNVNITKSSTGHINGNEISEVALAEGKNVIVFTIDNPGEYAFSLIAEHDVKIKM